MIPSRLWSVVVSQETQPVCSRLTSCAATWGTGVAVSVGAICVVAIRIRCRSLLDGYGVAGRTAARSRAFWRARSALRDAAAALFAKAMLIFWRRYQAW